MSTAEATRPANDAAPVRELVDRTSPRKLADKQVVAFDVEYVRDRRWDVVRRRCDTAFPQGDFRFLDVGGGNGLFADRLLAHYPRATGTIVDNSELLLSKNSTSNKKRVVSGNAEEIGRLFGREKFDVVFFNWVLHHLVRDSYAETRANILHTLAATGSILTPGGHVSIFENLYDGLVFDALPSRLVFGLTSSSVLAPLVGFFGANTAGVGVCFLSHERWRRTIDQAGLRIEHYYDDPTPRVAGFKRVVLHVGNDRVGHFWCTRTVQPAHA